MLKKSSGNDEWLSIDPTGDLAVDVWRGWERIHLGGQPSIPDSTFERIESTLAEQSRDNQTDWRSGMAFGARFYILASHSESLRSGARIAWYLTVAQSQTEIRLYFNVAVQGVNAPISACSITGRDRLLDLLRSAGGGVAAP